jgi:AcrR family transcriptional regulator
MARLTRAQQQQRTSETVLVAARREFAEHGFGTAKIDRVAERAELTRGAIYSNFPSKRALYLAVLVDTVERVRDSARQPASSPTSVEQALGEFARVWLDRLPLVGDTPANGYLQLRSLSGVLDSQVGRTALAELVRFEALLLGLALESRPPTRGRRVRLAELALTLLHGAGALAEIAPGVGDPFDLVRAVEHLGGIVMVDDTHPPHLRYAGPARPTDAVWEAPPGLRDEITGRPFDLDQSGVVVVLGVQRLSAAEEAVRASRSRQDTTTVVVVTGDPAETGRLAALRIVDIVGCLRRVFRVDDLPRFRLVLDQGTVTTALGLEDVDDLTEAAFGVRNGIVVARADGLGAGHVVTHATGSQGRAAR